jgi:cytochrome c biogenesis protein CcmG, thiol:disulfide interchange protein DsbE
VVAVKRLSPFAVAVIAGMLALVGLLAYGLSQNEPDRAIDRALARGETKDAPDFTAERLEGGGTGSLADYRGKVVVLNFWASWCEPCRDESPLLDRWHRKLSADGKGTVLGVDVLDVAEDAREFVDEFDLGYPMLRDGDGDVLGEYGVIAYPETFVIDRRGRIVASRRGPVDDAFMRREVAPLLEPS